MSSHRSTAPRKRAGRMSAKSTAHPATSAPAASSTPQDSGYELELAIVVDLIALAIEEIGNGTGRALSVLLPALRYVQEIRQACVHPDGT